MITDARSDDRSPTSLWVPLYLAIRCPHSVTTDPEEPLRMLLDWLYHFAKPNEPWHALKPPYFLISNPMRYTANIVGITSVEVYWYTYQHVIPKI